MDRFCVVEVGLIAQITRFDRVGMVVECYVKGTREVM